MTVHRLLTMPPFGSTDCGASPGTCRLRAVSATDYDVVADVPLDFDPSGPLPKSKVTVTPDTDLLNFQSVTLAGTGFTPSSEVQVFECKTGATSYDDCTQSEGAFAPTSTTGKFSLQFSVRRILHLVGGDLDCASAVGACSLVSSSYGSVPVIVASPVSFDDSVPPPPPPAISVAPDTDLVKGQQVTVTGSNFAPNAFVQIGECVTGSDPNGYCLFGFSGRDGFARADTTGSFTATFSARRGVLDFTNDGLGAVDCASAPKKCSITAYSYDGDDSASAPVDFDPSVPISVPSVKVSPRLGLADRALVDVHSSGFTPGEQVVVSQCDADGSTFGVQSCANGSYNILTADADGVVDTTLRVHRTLQYWGGVVIFTDTPDTARPSSGPNTANCAEAVGECVIRVQSLEDPLAVTDVPLGFDPTAVAPAPTLTTSPAGPFTDGQQVEVHGAGFTPGATLGLAQCEAGVDPSGHTCDAQPGGLFSTFTADQNGEFTRTVTIHAQVKSADATIDCVGGTAGCVLFAANRNDYFAERVSIPITFAATSVAVTVEGATTTHTLPVTGAGSSTEPLALAGGGALGLGLLLSVVTRRRRSGSTHGRMDFRDPAPVAPPG